MLELSTAVPVHFGLTQATVEMTSEITGTPEQFSFPRVAAGWIPGCRSRCCRRGSLDLPTPMRGFRQNVHSAGDRPLLLRLRTGGRPLPGSRWVPLASAASLATPATITFDNVIMAFPDPRGPGFLEWGEATGSLVPEPSTASLLGLGLVALAAGRRRR